MRAWCQPALASEFLRQFYLDNVFYMKKPPPKPPTPPLRREPNMLRPFLPKRCEGDLEVDNATFDEVLGAYYRSLSVPLLGTELAAIKASFASPATRKVELSRLEMYILQHIEPCRKHGRLVCGSCFYTGKCNKPGCPCGCYKKSGGSGSVCRECYHPPDMHARCPLQMRERALGASMLDTMNRRRDPDLSAPSSVRGNALVDIIVPPPDRDMRMQSRVIAADAVGRRSLHRAATRRMSSLAGRLTCLETGGGAVAALPEYWGQRETDLLHVVEGGQQPSATADVVTYPG